MDAELVFVVVVLLLMFGWSGSLAYGYDAGGLIHLLLVVILVLFLARWLAPRR